jgi:hypothetical protein
MLLRLLPLRGRVEYHLGVYLKKEFLTAHICNNADAVDAGEFERHLITSPNFDGGGGRYLRSMVVVAVGDPGVP